MSSSPQTGRLISLGPSSIRAELVPAAVLGAAGIGALVYFLQEMGVLLILLAMAMVALAPLIIIRPMLGLAGVVVSAALVRVEIGTGTESALVVSLVMAVALVAGWAAHQLLNKQRLNYLPRSVAVFGTGLVIATLFALVWGRLSLDPRIIYPENFYRVQIAAAMLVIVSVGLLFVGGDLFRARSARTALSVALIALGFAALPLRALDVSLGILNAAGLFGLWFVVLCWSNALSNGRLPTWLRLLLGAGAIGWLLTAATVQGSWVSGWLPPLIAILVVTILLRPRLGVALVLAGVVLTAAYYSIFYELLITQQQNEGSLGGEFGRLELWRRNLAVIQGRLLFGTGPAGYALYYTTFVPERAMSTHSNYIDTLAQFGVLGLASLLGLLASIWACGLRLLRRLEVDSDRAFCAAVTGGVAGVAASLWLGDWLLPFIYNQTIAGFDHAVYSWLMFAALCGLWAQNQTGAGRDGEA